MNSVWDKITSLNPTYSILPLEEVYPDKMDNLYLKICYYNLLEKYICGMFDDMSMIDDIVKSMVKLV